MRDEAGAFVPQTNVTVAGAAEGPLCGLRFAAKDLFDVQGHVTGAGNPSWAATHRFDGTPLNPRAPDRVPGGSSSGSASAVASGLADFSLGTDSGGSVRIPASFCGLYGLRPTHGAIPVEGMVTQSPSFDTAGFFAADAATFERVGDVLLPPSPRGRVDQLLVATDAVALCDALVQAAFHGALAQLAPRVADLQPVALAPEGLAVWSAHQQRLQCFEFGRTFAPWVAQHNPVFSIDVAQTLLQAQALREDEVAPSHLVRAAVRERLDGLLGGHRLLCLPTAPILPIRRDATLPEMQQAVGRILHLTGIAGLTGLPQVSLPLAHSQGIPVGISLIGPRGSDRLLLSLARELERTMLR